MHWALSMSYVRSWSLIMSFEIPLENLILAQIDLHSQTTNGHGTAYMTSDIIEQFGPLVTDEMLKGTESPELGAPWFILELLDNLKERGLIK